MRVVIGLVTCLCAFSGVAEAARLSSPAIFGAHTQRFAVCSVFNNGTEAIEIVVTILGESGEKLLVEPSTRLLPRQSVAVFQSLEGRFGVAHACTVDAAAVATLRASLAILERVGTADLRVILSVPLR
jgi:hypothetical protein